MEKHESIVGLRKLTCDAGVFYLEGTDKHTLWRLFSQVSTSYIWHL